MKDIFFIKEKLMSNNEFFYNINPNFFPSNDIFFKLRK